MAESNNKNVQQQTGDQSANQKQSRPASGRQQNTSDRGMVQSRGAGGQDRAMARRSASLPAAFFPSPYEIFAASPFELMRRFSEQMDQVFEEFGLSNTGRSRAGGGQQSAWSPAIEVLQREGRLVVRAELPGLDKDDVKVEMTDDGLVIQGERRQDHEERGEGFYRSERSYGRFYRLIPLPDEIDAEQVRAEFNNGVLEVTVPVPQAQQRRREIPINAQSGEQARAASAKQKQG